MSVIRAYRFALDPSEVQVEALRSHCGGQRFAYNWGLGQVRANLAQRDAERSYGISETELTPTLNWSAYGLRKQWNTAKEEVAPWWHTNSKEAYASGLANLAAALSNWKAGKTGVRGGNRMRFPRFKSKRGKATCRFTTGAFGLINADRRHVKLPRIGVVRTHESTRKLARHVAAGRARVRSATVSWRQGRWQVSFSVELARPEAQATSVGGVVGVDLGVKHLAVLSTGRVIANPKHLDSVQQELRRLQRQAARRTAPDRRTKRQPSKRWSKTQARIGRLHGRVANARINGLHLLSSRLVREFDTIVVEDLNVIGMLSNRRLARSVADVGMGELRRQLDYKARWAGRAVVVADRWYPSSKICSDCGAMRTKLRLSERTFCCDACGMRRDRDLNAARNLAGLVEAVVGTSTASCVGTISQPAGNPCKTTPSGGDGYCHGKTAPMCGQRRVAI